MILSLVDLALNSVSDGMEDGTIQNAHMLPLKLRYRVFDTVLKRAFIVDPDNLALHTISSVEFLNGMTSISTQASIKYDDELLQRLIKSMAVKLPNSRETVGAAITKLDLGVYGGCCDLTIIGWYDETESELKRSSFPAVSSLIARCPNTTSLALRGFESYALLTEDANLVEEYSNSLGDDYSWPTFRFGDFLGPWFPCFLNQFDKCYWVMAENLVELSISNWTDILDRASPIISFTQLTILKLDKCDVNVDIWPELLRKIQTLENLHMVDVNCYGQNEKDLDCILPFSMPHLKLLEIIGFRYSSLACNKTFVDNLMGCPELRQLHLMLDEKSTEEESLDRLAIMDIDLKIESTLRIQGNDKAKNAALIDSLSHFKIVTYLHERMESFKLTVTEEWCPLLSTALEGVSVICSNLTTFHICLPRYYRSLPGQTEKISKEDMKRINAAMAGFFGDSAERALQLKDLSLDGNFDEAVVSAVFENCLNLVKLELRHCPTLRDQHLIDWVSRDGGKLSHLMLYGCDNVTSEGIEAVKMHCPNAQIMW